MINLHYLHYFYVCAQQANITRAATILGISQPSLSMQIKSFEQQLGFPLFSRNHRSLELTPKGTLLYEEASKIFDITRDIEKIVRHADKAQTSHVNIGVSDEIERPFVAEIVGRLIKGHGKRKMTATITSKNHEEVVQLMENREADAILTNQKIPRQKILESFEIPVMLVSGKSDVTLKAQKHPNLASILEQLDEPFILPTSQIPLGRETKSFLKEQDLHFDYSMETNIISCIVRSVKEGFGCALLPVAYVSKDIRSGDLKSFGPAAGFWKHIVYLYAHKDSDSFVVDSLGKIIKDLSVLS